MNFTDHLAELRNRLIVTGIFFVVFFALGFVYVKDIYSFFEKDISFTLATTSPGDIIWIYFTLASIVAIVGTIPILSLQLWLFIRPGLTTNERKASLAYIPALFILFISGLVFGYIIFVKLILPFLLTLNDGMFTIIFTVDNYFRFLFRVTLPFAILFEIPIVSMFLTQLGILTPQFMKKTRKYAYFVLVIIGAVVTPPDFILQIVVAIPLIILYEISIQLCSFVYKKKLRKHEMFMKSDSVQSGVE
ncbi:twin-arginine translocase subunit TatC [Virgibacillus soli]|uniref:Sec-independent protein translocase protein TatC n=1 Tax=Paracerasibacillus soli TaxID=480284 RepID=A0ABU5CQY2_9BACI|nr:twin-arginine translocase subunit TatC [Virgibacillus soli]MDY0408266.1 twin-arginine translocase subunit TatC [Virgibacillus soli]